MGAARAQAADSTVKGTRRSRAGHPCGEDFFADTFLEEHPEFNWQRPVLQDRKANPWAEFQASDK